LPPFTYSRRENERAVMSYRRMPDRLYDDPDELAVWARAALAAAHRTRVRKEPAAKKRANKPSRAKAARTETGKKRRRR
jgi:DNA transformation protein